MRKFCSTSVKKWDDKGVPVALIGIMYFLKRSYFCLRMNKLIILAGTKSRQEYL